MKKRWLYLSGLIVLVIICIGILVLESNVINDYTIINVLKTEQDNGRISYLTKDTYNNEFYTFTSTKTLSDAIYEWLNLDIGEGQNYLVKISPKGEVLLLEHIQDELGQITSMVFDREDNYYLHLIRRDEFEKHILSESIVKYSSKGKVMDVIFKESYPHNAREVSYVYGFQGEGDVYFYYVKDTHIVRYIYTDILFVDTDVEYEGAEGVLDVVGTRNDASYIYTQDSKLLKFDENKETGEIVIKELFDFWYRNEVISGINLDSSSTLTVNTEKLLALESASYRFDPKSLTLSTVNTEVMRNKTILDNKDSFKILWSLMVERLAIWILLVGLIILLIYTNRFIKIYMLQQRRMLVVKLLAAFIPIILISMTIYVNYTYNHTYDTVKEELKNGKFMDFNAIIEGKMAQLDKANHSKHYLGTLLSEIELGDIPKNDFDALAEMTSLESFQVFDEGNGSQNAELIDMSGIYRVIDIVKGGHVYKLVDNEGATTFYPRYSRGDYERIFQSVSKGEEINSSSSGYIYSMRPIYNNEDKIVGIFQVGMNYDGYIRLTEKDLLFSNLKVLMVLTLGMILVLGLIILKIVLPIGTLTKNVRKVDENNLDVHVEINSGDEVEELADAFNGMTQNLSTIIENMTILKDAYYKFVPEEFFKVLDKKDVTDVALGDNVKLDMCIINSSISNYYEVSSQFSKEENFQYINDYLGVLAPVIRDNLGIIDRYLDRGLIGIFGNDGLNAVDAAILAGKKLNSISELKERFIFNFGIHRGEMLMGIIGEKERVQTIILSDNVTMTSELQELAYIFNATILATDSVIKPYKELIEFDYRYIGHVILKGRRNSLELYDIYESDDDLLRKKKKRLERIFLQAIEDYQNKMFKEARSGFVKILSKNSDDNIAKAYFYLSDLYFRMGVEEDWDMSLDLNKVELDSQR